MRLCLKYTWWVGGCGAIADGGNALGCSQLGLGQDVWPDSQSG